MVDVVATNDKLRARVRRIVTHATGVAGGGRGRARTAPTATRRSRSSILAEVDAAAARARLDAPGDVRKALDGHEAGRRSGARRRPLLPGDVAVDDGVISRSGSSPGRRIAAPGFVDLQVNGFAGIDFLGADADGYATAGEALLETGVTTYLPTLITSGEDMSAPSARSRSRTAGPRILGAHLEGPFLSPARLGTTAPPAVATRRRLLRRLLDAGRSG